MCYGFLLLGEAGRWKRNEGPKRIWNRKSDKVNSLTLFVVRQIQMDSVILKLSEYRTEYCVPLYTVCACVYVYTLIQNKCKTIKELNHKITICGLIALSEFGGYTKTNAHENKKRQTKPN